MKFTLQDRHVSDGMELHVVFTGNRGAYDNDTDKALRAFIAGSMAAIGAITRDLLDVYGYSVTQRIDENDKHVLITDLCIKHSDSQDSIDLLDRLVKYIRVLYRITTESEIITIHPPKTVIHLADAKDPLHFPIVTFPIRKD